MNAASVVVRRILCSALVLGAAGWALWRYWPVGKAATSKVQDDASATSRPPDPLEPAIAPVSPGVRQSAAATDAAGDGRSLLNQANGLLVSDPARAERLARQYAERYPDGPDMDECDALLVYAAWNGGGVYRAQDEALRYFREHPGGQYTAPVSKLTGMHPPFSPLHPPRSSP